MKLMWIRFCIKRGRAARIAGEDLMDHAREHAEVGNYEFATKMFKRAGERFKKAQVWYERAVI